jgi:hypothetical protein
MFQTDTIHRFLFFDVETVTQEPSFNLLKEKNPRLATLWSRRSLYYKGAYQEMKDKEEDEIYLQKASLEPEFSRIVCISFGSFNEDGEKRFASFCGDDEIDILNKANKVFKNAMAKNWKLCGHNIKGFDVPCLGKRMIYNKINPSPNLQIWDKKPWEVPFIDTSEVFAFGSWMHQKYLSLDLLSCSLGVESPKGDLDGSKVNSTYWEQSDLKKIQTYCEADVRTVMSIMEKTCF